MQLTLTNYTGKDLVYYYSGPCVIFEIVQNDSVLTSSDEGLCWTAVVQKGILEKDGKLVFGWRAPHSLLDSQLGTRFILELGHYEAGVKILMGFEKYGAIPSEAKDITITK